MRLDLALQIYRAEAQGRGGLLLWVFIVRWVMGRRGLALVERAFGI